MLMLLYPQLDIFFLLLLLFTYDQTVGPNPHHNSRTACTDSVWEERVHTAVWRKIKILEQNFI